MEEQWKLTCLIQPSCTKYFHRYVDSKRPTINKSGERNAEHASVMELGELESDDGSDGENTGARERMEIFAKDARDQDESDESDDCDSEFELPPPSTVKTDWSIARFRQRLKRDPNFIPHLKRLGLHPQELFSANYPFGRT